MASPPLNAKESTRLNYYQKLTGDDSDNDKARWDKLYSKHQGYVFGKEPVQYLVDQLPKLPKGRALDLAMGEGRNAVYMAKKGFNVEGVDISEVAIRKAKRLAQENGVRIRTIAKNINKYQIEEDSYDVILDFYFLNRNMIEGMKKGLKKGGVIILENYTVEHLKYDKTQEKEYLLNRYKYHYCFHYS